MLFGPGADSGTFDYFTEAVNGKAKASRGDYTASEDDNTLVQGVENNKGALGYFGFAYYAAHKDKLRAVADRRRQRPGAAEPRERDQRHLPAPFRVRCSSTSRNRRRPVPRSREFVQFMMTQGPRWSAKSATCRCRECLQARLGALQQQEARLGVRRRTEGRHHDRAAAVDGSQALIGAPGLDG